MKKCFIVSPIGTEGSDIRKRADQLFKHIIAPVCKECDFEAIRVDQLNQADSINETILDYLRVSELVIADITGHNPNAFYEMGYRASIGKPMIHVKEKGEKIPFDISGIRAFDYDLKDLDAVVEIKERLKKTILSFNIDENQIETNENDGENTNNGLNEASQLLPILYDIQDQIASLRDAIQSKDTETIQAIVKASQPVIPVEDPETALMKAVFPELLKNPSAMKTLIQLSEIANKQKGK